LIEFHISRPWTKKDKESGNEVLFIVYLFLEKYLVHCQVLFVQDLVIIEKEFAITRERDKRENTSQGFIKCRPSNHLGSNLVVYR
jgi:hypothetical protein